MYIKNNQGSALITIVITMILMAVLGVGIYTLTTSSTLSELLTGNNENAYQLARTGIRYGYDQLASNPDLTMPATTFKMPDDDHTFTVTINNKVITSTGVVNPNAFWGSRRTLTFDASGRLTLASSGGGPGHGFDEPGGWPAPVISPTAPGDQPAITPPSPGNNNTVSLGGNAGDAYGSIWYSGNNANCNCTNGSCDFGIGFRSYFEFTFVNQDHSSDSTDYADGFTFAVMSAINNEKDRTGGAPTGVSIGELMGYAGPGNTTSAGTATTKDGLGLKPPKLALEFDTYPNDGTNQNICDSDSRNDANISGGNWHRNHAALMFWGDRTASGSGCVGSPNSYDDNEHDEGDGGQNPLNTDNQGAGYYEGPEQSCLTPGNTCRFMEDGRPYSARIEIVRPASNTANNTYPYVIKAWIALKSVADANPLFKDVTAAYAAAPQLTRTVNITNSGSTSALKDHSNFDKMYFGFTEATGGSYQQATLANLNLYCPAPSGCPAFSISTTSPLPSGTSGQAYTTTVTATGGVTPYSMWGATGLPNGLTMNSSGVISGTPTQTGTFSVTVSVQDNCATPQTATQVLSITIAAPACTGYHVWDDYTSSSGRPFAVNSWCNPNVNLVPGDEITDATHLFTSGVINRYSSSDSNCNDTTPPGHIDYALVAPADANGDCHVCYSGDNSVTDCCPAVSISTTSLPAGTAGVAGYSATLAATGGNITGWSLYSGSLPPGLILNLTTGEIYGAPTTVGTYSFRVTATNSCGDSQTSGTLSITIIAPCPAVTAISPTGSLPGGSAGTAYSQTMTATGGTITSWAVASGSASLTARGLSLNTSTGVISGANPSTGTATFTVTATNSCGNSLTSGTLTITISCPAVISISPGSLPDGTAGTAYSQLMTASGGTITTWAVASGSASLTARGLSLNTSTGVISGANPSVGTATFTVTATNSCGNSLTSGTLTITINASPCADGYHVWNSYNDNGRPFGVTNPPSSEWCNTNTNLVSGDEITDDAHLLTSSTGTIGRYSSSASSCSGAPSDSITYNQVVTADTNHDCNVCYSSSNTAIECCPAVTVNTTSLPGGTAGTAYSQTLTASGGDITSWAIASGSASLTARGLSLNTSTGVISGANPSAGTATFTVRATNSCGSQGTSGTLTITITANYTVTPSVSGGNGSISPSTPQLVNQGSTATFTLSPNSGYTVSSVTGTCGGTLNGLSYTTNAIASNCTVVAAFTANLLTANATGTGTGTVASSVGGISYTYPTTTTGSANITYNTSVILTATASAGSTVVWSGNCSTTGGTTTVATCTVSNMIVARTVSAAFTVSTNLLTANATGTGTGTVASNVGGISYTYPTASTGSANITYNTTVVLTATAATGSTVVWSGNCSTTGGTTTAATCTVSNMILARTVSAAFTASTNLLTANATGTGTGTVASNVGGISYTYPATTTGSASINYNTSVILTATASAGSTVVWSGNCSTTGGTTTVATCTVSNMILARTVSAAFTVSTNLLTANATGTGTGTVASNVGGISYTYPATTTGSASINYNTSVILTATASAGSTVVWSGNCSTTGGTTTVATCTVSNMILARTVSAAFTVSTNLLTANATGTGTGTVASNVGGISYTYPTTTTGSANITYNTTVVLTATAATGSTVVWSGNCTSTGGTTTVATCTVSNMILARTVSAAFTDACTGGTRSFSGGETIHTFTSSGTLTCTVAVSADVLVVAGGGGGGSRRTGGGGGGGGGFLLNTSYNVTGSITIVVGAGGAGGGTSAPAQGGNGGNSSFGNIVATGGGGGGLEPADPSALQNGKIGGSGGGGGQTYNCCRIGLGGNGTSGQGTQGGNSFGSGDSTGAGGGGGGAGGSGSNASSGSGGLGGIGILYNGTTYSIGGRGGWNNGPNPSPNGGANTGNGGAGASTTTNTAGGAGGSGIVKITY